MSTYFKPVLKLQSKNYEALFSFAKDFYEVVSDSIIGSGPAVIPRAVGHGFVRLVGALGLQHPSFDFEDGE